MKPCTLVCLYVTFSWLTACHTREAGRVVTSTIVVFSEKPTGLAARASAPGATAEAGMIYVPGGLTQIGSPDGQAWERPQLWVVVAPFLLDEHLVSVADFRQFVVATQYKTQAERFGNAAVFDERPGSPTHQLTNNGCC